ncbi:MAG: HTTM domain-containing protein [Candidatus Melainabacteria bacterium]|nr:HTTM domain-containing protein [Candidatus Melainabacteria bacterium]
MKSNNTLSLKIKELFSADLRSLAILRIGISVLVIFDIIFRFSDLAAFYSDEGVLPRSIHIDQYDSWYASLYMINGLPLFQVILFLLTIFFAMLLLIGYRTRIMTIILWFLMVSLHARNPMILTGGDTLLHLILFWGIFLPLGTCYSVDSLLNPKNQQSSQYILSLGTFALFMQIVFVYLFTAICKISPEWLSDGSAIYYALHIDQYVTHVGLFIRQFPQLMKLLTRLVYGFEILGPVLLFTPIFTGPVRTLTIAGFFCLQLGFGSCLSVGIFPFSTSVAMLAFLPSWFWDRVLPPFLSVKSVASFFEALRSYFTNFVRKTSLFKQNSQSSTLNTSWFCNVLVVSFFIITLMWNVQSVGDSKFQMPEWIKRVSYLAGIEQGWIMFGPKFLKEDFWYVYPGTLKNGQRVDLFKGGGRVNWEKPKPLLSTMYKNHRWRTYIRNVWVSGNKFYPFYGQYLCRSWNKKHKNNKSLASIEFYYVRENTLPDNKVEKPVIGLMYKHVCY